MNPFEKHLPSNQAVKFYKNQFCRQTDPQFVKHRNVKDQFAYQVDLDDDYAFLMAQDVASILIKAIKERAQRLQKSNVGIKNALVTVPVYFTEQQKSCLKEACRIAGLNGQIEIVEEPKAALMAFGT